MALGLVGDNLSEIILTKIHIYFKVFNPKRAESNYFVHDLIFGKENCVKNGKSLLHAAAIPLDSLPEQAMGRPSNGER